MRLHIAAVKVTNILWDSLKNLGFILCVSGRHWLVNWEATQFHLPFIKVTLPAMYR